MGESNQGMQKTCIRLVVIIIIVGIIGSIAMAWSNNRNGFIFWSKED